MDVKKLIFPPIGTKATAIVAFVIEILALASLVIGIIADVKQDLIGEIDPYAWFFIAIALFIYGLWWWLTAYFAAKE